ncbi:MAG: acetate--CoA ligase family protein [Acidobacteria bacterium]|nr:acetate--CoA ligase family protein [Acidobacteriota bacterium]
MERSEVAGIFKNVRRQGRTALTELEAKQVLAAAGLNITREGLAASEEEALAAAERIGFPVVLKVASPDILHKSDAGGVQIGLTSRDDVRKAYCQIRKAVSQRQPNAHIQGVLVQEMVHGGIETIVGVTNREPFGPVVAFGLGGIFVELFKDIVFRIAPVDEMSAREMLGQIQGARMLEGYRGLAGADKDALARVIVRLSELAIEFHDHIEELDVNPLVALGDRTVALDALIVLKKNNLAPMALPTTAVKRQDPGSVEVAGKRANDIRAVLEPRSVAVVGASANPEKSGHVLLKNIIANGFPGAIYPINPKVDQILGYKAYPTILDVPGEIDLVFFLLPGGFIPKLYADCKKKRVKATVIVSAGFSEVGEEGAKAQRELEELICQTGVRCVGPNTIGFVNMDAKLVASFAFFKNWQDGPIALAAQSGIFAGAVADQLMDRKVQRIGIGTSLAFGNKIDLDESDFIEWASNNAKTRVIALHLEGIRRPRRFFSLANNIKRDKPIIVLKPGRTQAGARAAASHTGSLALNDVLVDQAFQQYGIIRAYDLEEFLEFMKAFSYLSLPKGNRVGVVTFSGANGVMASDELTEHGFELAQLAPPTADRIKKFLPPWQPVTNPLDLWAALGAGNRLVHEEGLHAALDDQNVDAVLLILLGLANADFDGMRAIFLRARERHADKPLYTVILGGPVKQKWLQEVDGLNMPVFETTRIAVKALAAMRRYALVREQKPADPLFA